MRQRAFTLLELLAVIAIMGLIVALLLPAISRVRSQGHRAASLANLRQITLGLHQFAQDNHRHLPSQVDSITGLDWSGQLAAQDYLPAEVFSAPEDKRPRRPVAIPTAIGNLEPRSYGNNSAKFTYLQNGYQAPWPVDIYASGALLDLVPGHIILIGENFGGDGGAGAYVGIPEGEGLDGLARDLYPGGGACYARADGSAFFSTPKEMSTYRADTDYAGDPQDPWKWKP